MKCIVLCVCLLVVGPLLVAHGDVVTLPGLGMIEGSTTRSYSLNRTIYQFQGIPYAKPPVGELRFKRPQKWDTAWNGTRSFTSFGDSCPQLASFSVEVPQNQSEDCLTINVYTNKLDGGGLGTGQAVMVFIHGGSFIFGSAHQYEPDYLLDEDVVLVVPQYRLGLLGFLSLKTEEIPGNMGMLDMILALEWVRDNIHVFGGDASRVTLLGHSAGAAAVTLMLFSPLVSDGLIQRVIAQSGSAVASWAVDADPILATRTIAEYVECNYTDDSLLAGCLKNLTYQEIIEITFDEEGGTRVVWNEAGNKSFLLQDPAILLREGKFKHVPMMSGITKHEGLTFLISSCSWLRPASEGIEYIKYSLISEMMRKLDIVDRTGSLASIMENTYFEEEQLGNLTAMLPGLVDIVGVAYMKAPTITMAKEMSRYNNSYMYSFNYAGSHSAFDVVKESINDNDWKYNFTASTCPGILGIRGVSHGDDIYYLFPFRKVLNNKDREISKRMVQLWTSFAKNGVPEAENYPAWPSMSNPRGPYLRIDKDPELFQNFVKEEYRITVKEGFPDRTEA